jgi:hypothetical protein
MNGVFFAVRAEMLYEGQLEQESSESCKGVCEEST